MKMKIALKNVKPNPFRHLERYTLQKVKLEALKRSIDDTEFWENIVARSMGDGTIEIAYGHHRRAVLLKKYSPDTEFDFIIKDIDDTNMAKIMAHENMEEWGSDASVEQETIRAIVEGYAEGRIKLPALGKNTPKTQIRYAPKFSQGTALPGNAVTQFPYTSQQLEEFLGWKPWKIKTALAALEKIEAGSITEEAFRGTTTKQQEAIVAEVNKIERRAEAKVKSVERVAAQEEASFEPVPEPAEDEQALVSKEQASAQKAKTNRKAALATDVKKIRQRARKDVKKVAKALNDGFTAKEGTLGTRAAAELAAATVNPVKPTKEFPDISPAAERLGKRIEKLLNKDTELGGKIRELLKNKKHIHVESKKHLVTNLKKLAAEATDLANKFEA